MYLNIVSTLLVVLAIDSALACNGYKAKIKKWETCSPDSIIKADEGFTVKLSKKCELIPNGCISMKGFSTAKATYTVTKDGISIKDGTLDICEAIQEVSSEAKNFLKVFAVPEQCPVAEGKICANDNTKADISKYKHMMGLARGDIIIKTNIKHDTGVSCLHAEIEITK